MDAYIIWALALAGALSLTFWAVTKLATEFEQLIVTLVEVAERIREAIRRFRNRD